MAIQTHRLGKNKFITIDSYYRPVPPIFTAIVVCVLLLGAGTYALTYENPVCPPGRTEYHGPAC